MSVKVVVGLQWGDEGKGKIIDCLSPNADYVIRYQGGNNAGHTVVVNGEKFILQLLPSGVVACKGDCIIGPGVVIDLNVLSSEIQRLTNQGLKTKILIDYRAHIIMPYHILLDRLKEERKGENKIGTTVRGIGPCYIDKLDRIGFRIGDLLLSEEEIKTKVKNILPIKNQEIASYNHEIINENEIIEYLFKAKKEFQEKIIDIYEVLNPAIKENKNILLEGAQALMLDIDYGTYPYVTSSSPSAGGACVGSSLSPKLIDDVYGVTKAYATRVGEGPMPTELFGEIGQHIRDIGHEYGTNTKRPRRCGWLDLVLVKYAVDINGVTKLVITKLDCLDQLPTIKVAVAYEYEQKELKTPPINYDPNKLKVIYKEFKGWCCDTSKIKNYSELPDEAKDYLNFIKEYLEVDLELISVGPDRNQNIIL